MGLRDRYEAHHKVKITDESITAAVKLSSRYISDRFLPDKAIDLVDEAASRVRLRAYTAPPALQEKEKRLKELGQEKAAAINAQEFEKKKWMPRKNRWKRKMAISRELSPRRILQKLFPDGQEFPRGN